MRISATSPIGGTNGPEQLTRIREIVALRSLGLSLAQIKAVLAGKSNDLNKALAEHQARLEGNLAGLFDAIETVRVWRNDLSDGRSLDLTHLATRSPAVSLVLP